MAIKITKVLWATRIGNEDWQEEIITTDETKIPDAKKWAMANGFDRFRVQVIDQDEVPDFTKVLNKKRGR
jgi:hypothetical protein